jgi:hypothetical protein
MADKQVVKVFTVDVTSGATLSSAIDLNQGWSTMNLKIPSFSSASDIFIHAAEGASDTFVRVMHPPINSATAAVSDFKIASGLSGRIIPIPVGYEHMKIELSTGQTDVTSTFEVICKS